MKKIVALTCLSLVLAGATAYAAPMTDFQNGKTEIEYSRIFNSSVDASNTSGYNQKPDASLAYGFKITHSFDQDLAIQYAQQRIGSDPVNDGYYTPEAFTIKTRQANIIYQANKYIYPFVGARWVSFASDGGGYSTPFKLKQTNMQLGVTVAAELSPRFALSATSAFGKDFYDISTELTYELSKTNKTKLGIGYQWLKYEEYDDQWGPDFYISSRHRGPNISLTMGF